jgi:hypothetical protein
MAYTFKNQLDGTPLDPTFAWSGRQVKYSDWASEQYAEEIKAGKRDGFAICWRDPTLRGPTQNSSSARRL